LAAIGILCMSAQGPGSTGRLWPAVALLSWVHWQVGCAMCAAAVRSWYGSCTCFQSIQAFQFAYVRLVTLRLPAAKPHNSS
jgi:hypothetical protein